MPPASTAFWIDCGEPDACSCSPSRRRLERAIGVIYRPETERQSHYFPASLSAQFDLVVHLDRTHAVEPLEPSAPWVRGEPPRPTRPASDPPDDR